MIFLFLKQVFFHKSQHETIMHVEVFFVIQQVNIFVLFLRHFVKLNIGLDSKKMLSVLIFIMKLGAEVVLVEVIIMYICLTHNACLNIHRVKYSDKSLFLRC